MATPRTDELQLRLRAARGRRLIGQFLTRLSVALGTTVGQDRILSLQETDRLREEFFARVRAARPAARTVWPLDREGDACAAVCALADSWPDAHGVLLSHVDRYVGAVRVPARVLLARVCAVWPVVREDYCVMTQDLGWGLCLEYNEAGPACYELTHWAAESPT